MLAKRASANACWLGFESKKACLVPFLYHTRTIQRDFSAGPRNRRGEDYTTSPYTKSGKSQDGSKKPVDVVQRKAREAQADRPSDQSLKSHEYQRQDDDEGKPYRQSRSQIGERKRRGNVDDRKTRWRDRPSGRPRESEGRVPRENLVPFEGKLPTTDLSARVEGSTMTPKELRIFEQLFKVKPTQVQQDEKTNGTTEEKKALKLTVKGGRDEAAVGVAYGKAKRLRKLQSKRQSAQSRSIPATQYGVAAPRPVREFPDLLRPLAEEAAALRARASIEEAKETIEDRDLPANYQDEPAAKKLESIKTSMDEAKTDLALWNTLQTQMFTYVRILSDSSRPVKAGRDFQILTQTLPQSLLYFMKSLRDSFPGSLLGLVLLPTLKKLGPSAFALGASTEIFNEHMWLLYKHYADLDGIAETLSEMDKDVYEFDSGTSDLIATILRDGRKSLNNGYGPGMQALWSTDRKTRGLEKIRRWEGIVEERLKAAALRAAQEEQANNIVEDEAEAEGEEQKLAVA